MLDNFISIHDLTLYQFSKILDLTREIKKHPQRFRNKLKGKIVECVFIVELPDLNGRKRLKDIPIYSVVKFEGE